MGKISKFCQKVYWLCRKVPRGRVTTYKILAEKLGTKAYRAVGATMNKNPYGILSCKGKEMVPCHRVINSSGFVGQFAHGSKAKIKLLQSEGIKVKNNKIIDFDDVLFRF